MLCIHTWSNPCIHSHSGATGSFQDWVREVKQTHKYIKTTKIYCLEFLRALVQWWAPIVSRLSPPPASRSRYLSFSVSQCLKSHGPPRHPSVKLDPTSTESPVQIAHDPGLCQVLVLGLCLCVYLRADSGGTVLIGLYEAVLSPRCESKWWHPAGRCITSAWRESLCPRWHRKREKERERETETERG